MVEIEKLNLMADKIVMLAGNIQLYRKNCLKDSLILDINNDISERQFKILMFLAAKGKSTISSISEFMNINKSTASIVISKLVKKEYVLKKFPEGNDDKRRVYFYLSDRGRDKLEYLKKQHFNEFCKIYESFNYEQQENMELGSELIFKIFDVNSSMLLLMGLNEEEVKSCLSSGGKVKRAAVRLSVFVSEFLRFYQRLCKERLEGKGLEKTITRNQFFVLYSVHYFEYNTISKLEAFFNSSSSTVSIGVSRLVKNGYLYKEYPTEEEDKRVVYIRLTEKGIETLNNMHKSFKLLVVEFLKEFSEEKLYIFDKAIDYFLKVFKI